MKHIVDNSVTPIIFDESEKLVGGEAHWSHIGQSYYRDWFEWQQVMKLAEKNATVRNAYEQLLILCRLAEGNNEQR